MKPNTPFAPQSSRETPEPSLSGRRVALRTLAGAGALLVTAGLGGCGFALRQAPKFAFESVLVTGFENTPVSRALQQAMVSSGIRVIIASRAAQASDAGVPAQVVLNVIRDQHERVVAGQTDSGQVRELTLRTRFRYTLSTPVGKVLLGDTELLLERDISFSETEALAKSAEEQTMFADMDGDIVQQALRRLAAVKAL
jgi:LPS-assembly lipoprotein